MFMAVDAPRQSGTVVQFPLLLLLLLLLPLPWSLLNWLLFSWLCLWWWLLLLLLLLLLLAAGASAEAKGGAISGLECAKTRREVWHRAVWTKTLRFAFRRLLFAKTRLFRTRQFGLAWVFAVIRGFSVLFFLLAGRLLSSLDLPCFCFFLLPCKDGEGGWGGLMASMRMRLSSSVSVALPLRRCVDIIVTALSTLDLVQLDD